MSEDSFGVPATPVTPQTYAAAPEPYSALPESAPEILPLVDPAPVPSTEDDGAHSSPRRKRRLWLWWTAGSVVAASLVGLCAYLAVVSHQWSTRVDELTAVSHELGTEVSEQTSARKTAVAEAAALQLQLDTAKTRITTLADEEANANDRESVWIDLVDAFIECEDGWVKHAEVLKGKMVYPATTTARAEAELVAYCEGLITDYADYKAEIGK